MVTILFNRETLAWTGTDREPLLSEIPVHDIDVEKFNKGEFSFQTVIKRDDQNNPLYVLVSPGGQEERDIIRQEHITEVTDTPLLIEERYEKQLKDKKGNVLRYHKKIPIKSTKVSNKPVLVKVLTHSGFTWEQEKNSQGELLYHNFKEVGKPITCLVDLTREVQATNENGDPLYVKFIPDKMMVNKDPIIEEITRYDPRWTENLYFATEQEEVLRTVTFKNNPEEFTFLDTITYKLNKQLGTSFSNRAIPLLNAIDAHKSKLSPLDGDTLLGEFSDITYATNLEVSTSRPTKYITFTTETSVPVRMRVVLQLSNGVEILSNSSQLIILTAQDTAFLNTVDSRVRIKVINYDTAPVKLSMPTILY